MRKAQILLLLVLSAIVVVWLGFKSLHPLLFGLKPLAHVNLEEASVGALDSVPNTPPEPQLRVAVAPIISPENAAPDYKRFGEYLGLKVGRKGIGLLRQDYAQTNALVRQRLCELAFVCSYAFVAGEKEFGMQPMVIPVIKGATTYYSLIVVRHSIRAQSLLDLEGKRFATADSMSTSGWLFPAIWLHRQGKDIGTFFSRVIITGSHDLSLEALKEGQADVAAVDSIVYEQMVEADPSLPLLTRVLLKSPPYGMPPLVVHPEIDPGLKEQLLTVLLRMHEDKEGRKVLSALRIDRFVIAEPRMFDSVRRDVRIWESIR